PDPTKSGYDFDYWFNVANSATGDTEWDFDTAVTANITLKAKWNETDTTQPTAPTVSVANATKTETLAANLSVTLSGTVTKGTNEIQTKEWALKSMTVSGVTPVFADKTALETTVTGIKKAGTYVFELKATDTAGLEGTATVTVTVNGYTVTTSVTVNSNSFSSTPGTSLDFTPSYSNVSNAVDFTTSVINSCLTYTITVVNHDGSYTNTWNST
ncbi:PKD domain-containing protein, partial [Treponema sp. R8-4-B8]